MTIHLSQFLPALLLLLYPADKLLSSRIRLRSFESFRNLDSSPGDKAWWQVPLLWIDPVRGLAGALLLRRGLGIDSPEFINVRTPAYWLAFGLMAVAVAAQMFTRREEEVTLAPLGFVSGLVAGLVAPAVVLITVAMATAALFAIRRFQAFFIAGAITVILVGLLLHTRKAWLLPAAGLLALPPVIAFLKGSVMEIPMPRPSPAAPLPEHRG